MALILYFLIALFVFFSYNEAVERDDDMIEAVFLDIDGTYYDHTSNQVLPESKEAVKQLKRNGYRVVLCSGRALSMARSVPVFDGIEWDGFIGGGGNFVYDKNFQCIWKHTFSMNQLAQIFPILKQQNIAAYVTGEDIFLTRELNQHEEALLDIFHMHKPKIRDWDHDEVHMMSLLGKNDDLSMLENIENVLLQPSCDEIMDVLIKDGNKARGISHLLTHLGIPQGNYLAFGDNLNDLEMLQQAEIGVAMGNGAPQLKAYADIVCAPSHEPGIAQTLKQLKLI